MFTRGRRKGGNAIARRAVRFVSVHLRGSQVNSWYLVSFNQRFLSNVAFMSTTGGRYYLFTATDALQSSGGGFIIQKGFSDLNKTTKWADPVDISRRGRRRLGLRV